MTILLLLIALIWLGGALFRIYRQARFYQIEEYMSLRYLRRLFAERSRWLPTRPIAACFIGAALTMVMSEASGAFMPALIGIASALIAVWPQAEGEVKKAFRPTERAKRMLGAAFVVTA